MENNKPIDVVVAWVDGQDPAHKKKMAPYLSQSDSIRDDRNAPTRFNSEGEIFYCVGSILRFAPFVRKIFIITDNQNPNLDSFIQTNFPDNQTPIVIVDHKVLFEGFESYLPTFNSLSIETCLFRIPDLSENFVYFNDDFFLVRDIKPSDWFQDDKPVGYGYWRSIFLDTLLWHIKPKRDGHKPFGFKDSMLNAAKILSLKKKYFHIDHTPLAMKKSVLKKFFTENNEAFIANISHKFRHETQFNPQALFYMYASQTNECVENSENKLLYLKPVNREKSYVDRKIRTFKNNENLIFCCIGSIDLAKEEDRNRLFDFLKTTIQLKFEE